MADFVVPCRMSDGAIAEVAITCLDAPAAVRIARGRIDRPAGSRDRNGRTIPGSVAEVLGPARLVR